MDAVEALVRAHEKQVGRPASAEERAALVRQAEDDEVLYREAVALRLDQGDPIIRRRLVEKMRMLTLAGAPEPTAEEVAAFRAAHAERYVGAPSISLTHVYFRAADAERISSELARLRTGAPPKGQGDPFPHGSVLRARTQASLAGLFGSSFAREVATLPVGEWRGPIASSFGKHLLRVDAREAGPTASDDVVRKDLMDERRRQQGERTLEQLRARYHVEAR